jgi:hypothetical protein
LPPGIILPLPVSAKAITGMNNVYHRFQHLTGNQNCCNMPARLRMKHHSLA